MDGQLHSRSKASHTDWFGAAAHVTDWPRGLGSIDGLNAGFVTAAEESYLRYVHHSLAPKNYETFGLLVNGRDVAGYEGLKGWKLDHALVDKEQRMVTMYTKQYFGHNVDLRKSVMEGLSKSFDHTNSFRRMMIDPKVLSVLDGSFGKTRFNLDNEAHRRVLGYGLVDMIREERKH